MAISHAIWTHAKRSLGQSTVNLSGICELLNVRIATLWTYHHGKARWPADLFIKSLIAVGAAQIDGDNLVIPIPTELVDGLKQLANSRALRAKTKRHGDISDAAELPSI